MGNGSRRAGALAGLAATAAAIGAAELVAAATGPRTAPFVAVGGVVVDAAPAGVKQFAIDVFGLYDKVALLVGTAVLLAGLAVILGILAVRSLPAGLAGVGLIAVIGVAAALSRPGAGPSAALPALVGGAVGMGVLWALTAGPLRPTRAPDTASGDLQRTWAGDPVGRRRFLWGVVATMGLGVAGGLGGRWLSVRRGVLDARAAIGLPKATDPAPAVPQGADLAVPGVTPYVTPSPTFYRIDTALVVPQVNPEGWKLRITGRVRNPLTLTYAELLDRPLVERYITLACVSNEVGGDLIGNARWLGVPVRDLLDEADPHDGADQVVARSTDGWTCGTPTAVLRDGRDALLAVGMNGEPLPLDHGFPARVVVPGLYGYVSACKWVVELMLTSFDDFQAYWVPRGWAAKAPIKTQSRIDVPRGDRNVTAGQVTVAGVAWAQHRGIAQVEVRADDGPWQVATLGRTVSTDTWVQWRWRWNATPGQHRLQVRATDATGEVQTAREAPPQPDGATGWHTVRVTAV